MMQVWHHTACIYYTFTVTLDFFVTIKTLFLAAEAGF